MPTHHIRQVILPSGQNNMINYRAIAIDNLDMNYTILEKGTQLLKLVPQSLLIVQEFYSLLIPSDSPLLKIDSCYLLIYL